MRPHILRAQLRPQDEPMLRESLSAAIYRDPCLSLLVVSALLRDSRLDRGDIFVSLNRLAMAFLSE